MEETYSFEDKSGRKISLRPELTAPAMRFYVESLQMETKPLKLYYFGNCFRYDRPQKGRYREFWQFGVELIGSSSPLADAEVISLAYSIMNALDLDFELHIGHVGLLRHLLKEIEEDKASKIMRLIDKKDEKGLEDYLNEIGAPSDLRDNIRAMIDLTGSRDVLEDAKRIIPDFDFSHLETLCDVLDALSVEYTLNLGIARGLDYYTGVVFEAYAKHGLGAQKQICGGGSYRLAHLFGGEDVPATGFALGFDRIAEICKIKPQRKKTVVIVSFSGLESEAFRIADQIRKNTDAHVVVDVMGRNIKRQLSYANDIKADLVVIAGKKELEEGKITVKDMVTGEQKMLSIHELIDELDS